MQPINPNTFFKVPAAGWAPMTHQEQETKLKGQVDEFAAMLYAQMFQQMREAAKSDDEENGGGMFGGDSEMFAHFFDQQVGRVFAAGDGNNLKQALWQQMSKTLEAQVKAGGDKQ